MQNLQKQKSHRRNFIIALGMLVVGGPACGTNSLLQEVVCPPAHALAIVEIMANPLGTDAGKEWLEIYNTTQEPVNLQGFGLSVHTSNRAKSYVIGQALWIDANAYVVLGNGPIEQAPIDYSYGAGLDLPNHSATLSLLCGEQVIDEVAYGDAAIVPAPRPGASLSLAHHSSTAWCHTEHGMYDGENLGTPGNVNEPCGPDTCMDAAQISRLRHTPKVGDVQINAVYADPIGTNVNQQWLELNLRSDVSVDLAGLRLLQRLAGKKVRQWHVPTDHCQNVDASNRITMGLVQKHAAFVGSAPVFTTAVGSQQLSTRASHLILLVGDVLLDEVELPNAQPGLVWQRL